MDLYLRYLYKYISSEPPFCAPVVVALVVAATASLGGAAPAAPVVVAVGATASLGGAAAPVVATAGLGGAAVVDAAPVVAAALKFAAAIGATASLGGAAAPAPGFTADAGAAAVGAGAGATAGAFNCAAPSGFAASLLTASAFNCAAAFVAAVSDTAVVDSFLPLSIFFIATTDASDGLVATEDLVVVSCFDTTVATEGLVDGFCFDAVELAAASAWSALPKTSCCNPDEALVVFELTSPKFALNI